MQTINPMLSEFDDYPWLRWLFESTVLGCAPVVWLWFGVSLALDVFSYFAGAHCITAGFHLPGGAELSDKVRFGYLAELNHGFFYTILCPLILFVSCRFFAAIRIAVVPIRTVKAKVFCLSRIWKNAPFGLA
jgi:hypothetical protein